MTARKGSAPSSLTASGSARPEPVASLSSAEKRSPRRRRTKPAAPSTRVIQDGVLQSVREIYRQSKKKRDNFWTEWISRPPAAVLVYLLRPTSVTPNQVSFLAIAVAFGGAATLIAWRSWAGLLVAG